MGKQRIYAVRRGRSTGIFHDWASCEVQVKGFRRAEFKSFTSLAAAQQYLGKHLPLPSTASPSASSLALYSTSKEPSGPLAKSISSESASSKEPSSSALRQEAKRPLKTSDAAKKDQAAAQGRKPNPSAIKLVIYTDGSCIGNIHVRKLENPAGWGLVALEELGGELHVVAERHGRVVTSETEPGFIGAKQGSNNTGELTGIASALHFAEEYDPNGLLPVEIRFDSKYAAKSVQGEYNGKRNTELIEYCRRVFEKVKSTRAVSFVHVKGHGSDKYNDRADYLAKKGAREGYISVGSQKRELEGDVPSNKRKKRRS